MRWSITVPSQHQIDSQKYYKSFTEIVCSFLNECIRLGCHTYCDCNRIPICCFNDEQIRTIAKLEPSYFIDIACKPVLDVTPKLDIIRCFACSDKIVARLSDFPNAKIAEAYFRMAIDRKLSKTNNTYECKVCQAIKNCQGGCLALGGIG